jgi:lipoic acid synthetase
MILGNICTRGCRFCSVPKGVPDSLDREEPYRVADAVSALRLKYAVITSVTRDDLSDGGSAIFAETIQAIRAQAPDCRVEVLIPDFNGSVSSIITVLNAQPDVLSHNIETVPALYAKVRPQADYRRSVDLLTLARNHGAVTKAGIMLGLGENRTEVMLVMKDLRKAGCSILTLGQYLKPSIKHLPVEKYYHPDEFIILEKEALTLGFKHVVSGPLVRSSYKAGVQVNLSTDI